MATTEKVFAEAQKNDRVCPLPMRWQELYELLPNKKRKGGGWEPAAPLILAAWSETPAISKIIRLREHIEWAERQGCLYRVHAFLKSLPENDWHHINDGV